MHQSRDGTFMIRSIVALLLFFGSFLFGPGVGKTLAESMNCFIFKLRQSIVHDSAGRLISAADGAQWSMQKVQKGQVRFF